jgi:hypothetical protein
VFLLVSLLMGVIVIVVTDMLDVTGLGIGNAAIISAIITAVAIGLWKLSDTLHPPPKPYREFRDGRWGLGSRPPTGERSNHSGSADSSGLSAG